MIPSTAMDPPTDSTTSGVTMMPLIDASRGPAPPHASSSSLLHSWSSSSPGGKIRRRILVCRNPVAAAEANNAFFSLHQAALATLRRHNRMDSFNLDAGVSASPVRKASRFCHVIDAAGDNREEDELAVSVADIEASEDENWEASVSPSKPEKPKAESPSTART